MVVCISRLTLTHNDCRLPVSASATVESGRCQRGNRSGGGGMPIVAIGTYPIHYDVFVMFVVSRGFRTSGSAGAWV